MGKYILNQMQEELNNRKSMCENITNFLTSSLRNNKSIDNFEKVEYANLTLQRFLYPNIDYIARLRYGVTSDNNIASNSVNFIRSYFSNGYNEIPGIIYYMFRHGYLHANNPQRIKLNNGDIIIWSINFSIQSDTPSLPLTSIYNNEITIHLNIEDFIKNFLLSVDKYSSELSSDVGLQNLFVKGMDSILEPRLEENLPAYVSINDLNIFYGR